MKKLISTCVALLTLTLIGSVSVADEELVVYVQKDQLAYEGALLSLDGAPQVTVPASGLVRFDLSGGAHSMQLMSNNEVLHSFRFDSADGQLADVAVVLEEAGLPLVSVDTYFANESSLDRSNADLGRLSGVVSLGGKPIADAQIRVKGSSAVTRSATDGSYTLSLARGVYRLEVEHPDAIESKVIDVWLIANLKRQKNIYLKNTVAELDIQHTFAVPEHLREVEEVVVVSNFKASSLAGSACNIDAEGESGFAGGLGSGTTMDHIQVNSNADDGVEFYGGAVNAKFLVLTGNVDDSVDSVDSVDWDEGYQGSLQFVIVKQTADSAGNTIEADTEGTTAFFSMPFIMNGTFIGDGSRNTLHVMKQSSGGFIFNSVMTGAAGTIANCVEVNGSGAGANVGTSLVYDNVIADCVNFTTADSDVAASNLTAGVNIQLVAPDLNDLLASQAPEARLVANVDLIAFDDILGDVNDNFTADLDFLEATDYIGAVDPDAIEAWFDGWIIEGSL